MADVSLKKLKQATMPFMSFVDQFHNDVVGSKKARRNEDGSITTVFSTGIKVGDKIYEVPSYDPSTGKVLNEKDTRKKYLPLIESGNLQKKYGDFGIPESNYKTILNLYQSYKNKSDYNKVPDSAIKFDFFKGIQRKK